MNVVLILWLRLLLSSLKIVRSLSVIWLELYQTGNVDFKLVGSSVHQLKGSSSRYVALIPIVSVFCLISDLALSQNYERCVRYLQQVDIEYKTLKAKLQDLFNLI